MASRELWRRTFSAMQHRPWTAPASLHQVKRGFAVDRPEDSSTSNWGTGEPPIDEKGTKRGVGAVDTSSGTSSGTSEGTSSGTSEGTSLGTSSGTSSDSESEVPTPSLSRQKSTRDFIQSKREERMRAAEEGASPEVKKQQQVHEEVKETGAAHPGDMAGG